MVVILAVGAADQCGAASGDGFDFIAALLNIRHDLGGGQAVVMTSWPASCSAFTDSGYLSTQSPTTKKVVLTLYFARISIRRSVSSLPHGDAKVRQFTENYRTLCCAFMIA